MTTYKEFLEQHEYLTGRVIDWQRARNDAKDVCTSVEDRYNHAAPEEKSEIEPEMKAAQSELERREGELKKANDTLVEYEWQNREFDDARRDGVEPLPDGVEPPVSWRERVSNLTEGAMDKVTSFTTMVGVATQLNVAPPPNMDAQPAWENLHGTISEEQEREARTEENDEEMEHVNEFSKSLPSDPDDLKEEIEAIKKDMELNEEVNEEYDAAKDRGATEIEPPSDGYEIEGGGEFGQRPDWSYDQKVEIPEPSDPYEPANDNDPPGRTPANDNIPEPSDGPDPTDARTEGPAEMPDPDPPTSQVVTAPAPANDNHPSAANDNDPPPPPDDRRGR